MPGGQDVCAPVWVRDSYIGGVVECAPRCEDMSSKQVGCNIKYFILLTSGKIIFVSRLYQGQLGKILWVPEISDIVLTAGVSVWPVAYVLSLCRCAEPPLTACVCVWTVGSCVMCAYVCLCELRFSTAPPLSSLTAYVICMFVCVCLCVLRLPV